ncbi:hypothetical protein N0V90_002810 [Kalmusia sp. IMI 367209]|nr:hypothetical protein N0V90_002810 [Kalmusia sp. IMI 367209]
MSRNLFFAYAKAVVLIWCVACVIAQEESSPTASPSATFFYPKLETRGTRRLSINVLDTVVVEWESNFDKSWLVLYCHEHKPEDNYTDVMYMWDRYEVKASDKFNYSPYQKVMNDTTPGVWPYPCFFKLSYNYETQDGIESPPINITSIDNWDVATTFAQAATVVGTTTASTTGSPATSTPSTTGTNTTVSSTTSSASPTVSETTPPSPQSGLSSGAKAGIGVGVTGGVLAIAALSYLFYRSQRKLKELQSRQAVSEMASHPASQGPPHGQNIGYEQPMPPTELEGPQKYAYTQELPSFR